MPYWNFRDKNKELEAWLLDATMVRDRMPPFENWRQGNRGGVSQYVQEWIERTSKAPVLMDVNGYGPNTEVLQEISRRSLELRELALSFRDNPLRLELRDCNVYRLDIGEASEIDLVGCKVRSISTRTSVERPGGPRSSKIRFRDCEVGRFEIGEGTIGELDIFGSRVLRTTCPVPGKINPFNGSVSVRRTRFSSSWENAQHYRNLRHHLSKIHNHDAASVFHSAELQTEMQRQAWLDRQINRTYWALSNYGESSVRPLLWLLVFLGLNVLFLYFADGVTPIGEALEADGWRYSLYGFGEWSRLFRAVSLALTEVFNPLGIFGAKSIIAARTPLVQVVSMVLGLLGTISLGLFVLALRRRFRLDRSG